MKDRVSPAVGDSGSDDLRAQLAEAVEREAAVSRILQTISRSSFDLDELLHTVIENAVRLSDADYGNILRYDEANDSYRQIAHYGPIPPGLWELLTRSRFTPERGSLIGRTLLERRPIAIDDVLVDADYRLWDAQRVGGYRTILGVPLLRDGFPVGVIVLNRVEVRPFTPQQIRLVTTFADQAVLAMEQVRLLTTTERQRAELALFVPEVASLLSSDASGALLAAHRRDITAMFCDLRGFTAFAESAEPEEVMGVLHEYHAVVGQLVVATGGTVQHFAGDGILIFYNDPLPVPDHQLVAIGVAVDLQTRFRDLAEAWIRRGHQLGLGIGAASGFATLGRIGFEGRYDYGAVGNVVILASRLSGEANHGEILLNQRLHAAVEEAFETEALESIPLKGFSRPTPIFRAVGRRT